MTARGLMRRGIIGRVKTVSIATNLTACLRLPCLPLRARLLLAAGRLLTTCLRHVLIVNLRYHKLLPLCALWRKFLRATYKFKLSEIPPVPRA